MKRILSLIGSILLVALMLNAVPAQAAQSDSEDVEFQFTSNKETYAEEEEIEVKLTVKNNLAFSITNLRAEIIAPEGYSVENAQKLFEGQTLRSGKKYTTSIVLTKHPSAEPQENHTVLIIVLAAVVVLAVAAVVVFLIVKKKRSQKAVISVLLVCSMLGSILVLPVQAQGSEMVRQTLSKSIPLSIGGTEQTVTAKVYFDQNEHADDLQIDTGNLGYREDLGAFVIHELLNALNGTLKNAKNYSEIKLEIYDDRDTLLQKQSIPASAEWRFEPIGLFPGLNRLKITAVGQTTRTLQLLLYDPFGYNYRLLEGADVDTDGEGLFDRMEDYFGTDPQNPDTDGDGLTDYDEIFRLGTDPLKADSDDNGIIDGGEDYDGDQIPDAEEIGMQLSPILKDTDRDGITDYDEMYVYGTDPLKADSDGDGAEDGWEAENGYQPGVANGSFTISCETNEVSAANPVSAAVSLSVSGTAADVESLKINYASVANNPVASPCVAGYLGQMVDISIDGSFDVANLTFRYDPSLGTPSENFQPRIYHYNEETRTFEELENQSVNNGVVTAQTTHFSLFTLLNKAVYDNAFIAALPDLISDPKGYYDELKGQLNTLGQADFVFVIDHSASMAWNDPAGKVNETVQYFLDQMRPDYDHGAILKYTSKVSTVQPFTDNPKKLQNALKSIGIDNGVNSTSGTNGVAALKAALETLKQGRGIYQSLVFFSDGEDPSFASSYEDIKQEAISRSISITCIGVGITQCGYLEDLASATGGTCYYLGKDTSVDQTFAEVAAQIAAMTPFGDDSNNDGISDFFTRLIFEGKLPLENGSTQFQGLDFNYDNSGNLSADWDGDGLKNGDEIRIGICNDKACVFMVSDPTLVDSDSDGFSDFEEDQKGLDPLVYNIDTWFANDFLMDDNFPHSTNLFETYQTDGWNRFWINTGAVATLSFNREELYRDIYIQYIENYGSQSHAQPISQALEQDMLIVAMYDILKKLPRAESTLVDGASMVESIYKILHSLNQVQSLSDLKLIKGKANALFNKIEGIPDLDITISLHTKPVAIKSVAAGASDLLEEVGDGLSIAVALCDLLDGIQSCANISANNTIYMRNQDILEEIASDNSIDEYARAAADNLLEIMDQSYAEIILMEEKDFALNHAIPLVIKKLMSKNIYTAAILVAIDIIDKVYGISKNLDQRFQTYAYLEFARSSTRLFMQLVDEDTVEVKTHIKDDDYIIRNYYEVLEDTNMDDLKRYFYHSAHAHILGERQYYRWMEDEGLIGYVSDNSDVLDNERNFLNRIKKSPLVLNLVLDPHLFP